MLDEYIPFVTGSEINDDPFSPISRFAKILLLKEKTPISWLHRQIVSSKTSYSRCYRSRFDREILILSRLPI
jgi:hypothetical protein